MRLAGYSFRPGRWPTLATSLVLPLLVGLGLWQLDRAEQKRAMQARHASAAAAAPLDLNRSVPGYEEARYRHASAQGHYDPDHQILIDNQIRDGRAGYQVLTPLRLSDGAATILVDRGWVPVGPDRQQLPELPAPAGQVALEGVLDQGPAVGLRLGTASTEEGWPRRLAYLDYDYLDQVLPYPVLPYLLRLDPQAAGGYRRDWEPAPQMGPEKHTGYAVQWFGLATALVIIFLVVNLERKETGHDGG